MGLGFKSNDNGGLRLMHEITLQTTLASGLYIFRLIYMAKTGGLFRW
jgi:hypothetical protein